MIFSILPDAEADIEAAVDFYLSEGSTAAAFGLREELHRVSALLMTMPALGHPVMEGVRGFRLARYPYKLVYRLTDNAIIMLALAHERRAPGYWSGRQG